MAFMAPELLAPPHYNLETSVLTQEADIYAFSSLILQVVVFPYCNLLFFLKSTQVLTGQLPFRDHKPQELAYYLSIGARPEKPENTEESEFPIHCGRSCKSVGRAK